MVDLVDGLPPKFETLQNMISKNGTLSHGCIDLVVCILDPSHCNIGERVYCPYCSRDNIFVRLYNCSDCDLIIQKIILENIPIEEKQKKLRELNCRHAERTPQKGFPVNLLGVHLCNMYKFGLLDLIRHKSTRDQLDFIRESITKKSFNPFLSINRFFSYLEMGMYSHAKEIALFWDNFIKEDVEKIFLHSEMESVCENDIISELISLTGMILLVHSCIDLSSINTTPDATKQKQNKDKVPIRRSERLKKKARKDNNALNIGINRILTSKEIENKEKSNQDKNKSNQENKQYDVGNDISFIKDKATGIDYHLVDLLNGDLNAKEAYLKFLNVKDIDCISLATNSLMYMRETKNKKKNKALFKDAAGFASPLQFRFSEEGKEAASISDNKDKSLMDLSR